MTPNNPSSSISSDLMVSQVRLEREMIAATTGARMDSWFKDTATGRALDNKAMRDVLRQWLPILALAIDAERTGSGKRRAAVAKTQALKPLPLAYMALMGAVDGMTKTRQFTKVAGRVGIMVEREVALALDDELTKKIEKRIKGKSGYIAARLKETMISKHSEMPLWEEDTQIEVGTWLLSLVEEQLGIIQRIVRTNNKRSEALLEFNAEMVAELDALVEQSAIDSLLAWPMLVPPRPWEDVRRGPYITKQANRGLTLVRRTTSDILDKLAATDLSLVFEAVNEVQETAWAVNPDVLEAIKGALRVGIDLPEMPRNTVLEKPEEGASKNDWRLYFKYQDALRSKFVQSRAIMQLADKFGGYSRFYFPHNLDRRGRLYPIPPYLSPQGSDLSQGLLTFADSKPLGEHGRRWLAIYGANVFGNDKVSFDDRARWTEEHTDEILEIADDPVGCSHLWVGADKPYQYLAFCFEWKRVVNGATVSNLPVKMDATCSGIQHLSAIARDPTTAHAVNLVDSEAPSDVYGDVAAHLVSLLEQLQESDDEETQLWAARWVAYGIDRKTTKRSTMTLPYGSTQFSAREYVQEDLAERIGKGSKKDTFEGDLRGAAVWLTPHMWKAINAVVPGARETMDWLQSKAGAASKVGAHLEWTTPDGFLVVQRYLDIDVAEKQLLYLGKTIRIAVAKDAGNLNKRRQRSGMAPNFVHSMDAAALRGYVRLAAEHGITAHSLIHDSFGAHAGDTELMQQLIRRSFVELYQGDVTVPLMNWLEGEGAKVGEALVGRGFELSQVLGSKYFFS